MATNRISVLIDVAVDKANASLGSFRKSIQDADGAAGKFKAGVGGAFDAVKANAGNLAMAGGTALVAFGAKSVAAFQDTALAAGELRDSLGLTAEEASQYIEVANDLGVSTATLENSIGRMNVTASKTPAAFADIGAELVKNADGTTNVNETFLSTVEALNRIPDATARAAAAQRIFGKGWKDMAELIGLGANGIRDAMAKVEAGKVIDDKEIERARKYRESMDALKGVYEEMAVVIGGELVEGLTDTANAVMAVKGALDLIPGGAGSLKEALDFSAGIPGMNLLVDKGLELKSTLDGLGDTAGYLGDSITGYSEAQENATESTAKATSQTDAYARSLAAARSQWDQLMGRLNVSDAFRNAQTGFDDLEVAAQEAWDAAAAGADDAEEKARAYAQKIDDMTRAVLQEFIPALGSVPKEVTSSIVAMIDEGKFAEAERRMAMLTAARNAIIDVYASGRDPRLVSGARASGGPVSAGGTYLVGEDGPELLQMGSSSGNVIPNGATVGGGTFNVTINADPNPDVTVRKLREWVRRNGPIQGIT